MRPTCVSSSADDREVAASTEKIYYHPGVQFYERVQRKSEDDRATKTGCPWFSIANLALGHDRYLETVEATMQGVCLGFGLHLDLHRVMDGPLGRRKTSDSIT